MARSPRSNRGRSPGSGRPAASRASRPDQRRRTPGVAIPPSARPLRRPPRRSTVTTRAAFLALLVCGMTLALTVPLRQFFEQRERLHDVRAAERVQAARVAELEAQKGRLQDPAHIERLARERLRFVRPGEVPFIVLTPSGEPGAQPRVRADGTLEPPPPEKAWYAELWSSVEAAGAAPMPSPSPSPR
ncbi:MAG TPA: septum formation initiator family protein [Mycobacteriales bacterium]|nr:septum formation initiator family protein [Mycobacteriales bacterium]